MVESFVVRRSVTLDLTQMLETGQFSDVSLICEDWRPNSGMDILAHRVILSSASTMFNRLFSSPKFPFIVFLPLKFKAIDAALKLIYTGQAVVDLANMDGFMETCRTIGLFSFNVGVILWGLGDQTRMEGTRKRKRDDEMTSEESTSDCSRTSSSVDSVPESRCSTKIPTYPKLVKVSKKALRKPDRKETTSTQKQENNLRSSKTGNGPAKPDPKVTPRDDFARHEPAKVPQNPETAEIPAKSRTSEGHSNSSLVTPKSSSKSKNEYAPPKPNAEQVSSETDRKEVDTKVDTPKKSCQAEKKKVPPKTYRKEESSNAEPKVALQVKEVPTKPVAKETPSNPMPREVHTDGKPKNRQEEDSHKRNLRKLVQKLTRSGQPTCTLCNKAFANIMDVIKHIEDEHFEEESVDVGSTYDKASDVVQVEK